MSSRTGRTVAALALAAGFVLVALAGISVAVSGDTTDGYSAQTPQTPLGTNSANDEVTGLGDEALGQETAGQPNGEQGVSPDSAGGAAGPASLPSTGSASGGGGGNAASLPFTGLLAIPILVLGVAMLGTGLLLRRRRPTDLAA